MPEDLRLLCDLWSYIDLASHIEAAHMRFEKIVEIWNSQQKVKILKDRIRLAQQYRTRLQRQDVL